MRWRDVRRLEGCFANGSVSWSSSTVSADRVNWLSSSIFLPSVPLLRCHTIRVIQAMSFAVLDLATGMRVHQHISLSDFREVLDIQSMSIVSAVLDNEVFSWLDRRPHHYSKGFFSSLSVLQGDPSQQPSFRVQSRL